MKGSLEYEIQSLTQENEELRKQLKNLQTQFEKAVSVSSELEETYRKNAELSRALQESEARCADYSKRLEISMKNCEELEKRINQEPRKSPIKPKVEINKSEIIQLNSRIQGYEKQQIEYQEKISAEKKRNQDLQNQLNQIFNTASSYFNSPINDSNSLLLNLIKIPESKQNDQEEYVLAIKKLQSKVKKWKAKYKEQHERYLELQSNRPVAQTTQEFINLNTQISELKMTINSQNEKLKVLNEENSSIKTQNAQLSARIRISEMSKTENKETDEINYLNQINQLKSELNTTKISYDKSKSKQSELNSQFKKASHCINEQKLAIQAKDNEIETLNSRINQFQSDNKELAAQIKILDKKLKKSAKQVMEYKGELSEVKKIVQTRDNEIQSLNDEINKLKFEYKGVIGDKDRITEELNKNKIDLYALQSKLKSYQENLNQSKQSEKTEVKVVEKQNHVQIEAIPLNIWSSLDFPREISDSLNTIVRNQILESSSKVKSIFDILTKYYQEKLIKYEKSSEQNALEISDLKKNVNNFAQYLERRFPDLKIDFAALMTSDNARETFSEYIISLFSSLQNLSDHCQEIDAQIVDLYIALDADTYNDAISNAQKLREVAFASKNRIRDLKRDLSQIKSFFKEKTEKYDNITNNLEKDLNNIKSELDKKEIEVQNLNETNRSLKENNEKEINQKALIINDLQAKLSEHESAKSQLLIQNTSMNEMIKTLQDKFKVLTENYKRLSAVKDEMEAQLNQDLKEKEEHFEEQNQMLLKQIKDLTNESSDAIKRLRADLETSETEKDKAVQENITSNLKIKQLESHINAMQNDMQRNMKTLEIQNSMKLKSMQNELLTKINELESSKQSIINSITNNLAPLLATGERLDENALDQTLQGINMRFNHLMIRDKRIRELLNIGPMDSIEDEMIRLFKKQ